MSKQLLRCGTSLGTNVREGQYAQSKKDFISKMNIALKEAGETDYWLDVIHAAEYFTDEEYASLDADNKELRPGCRTSRVRDLVMRLIPCLTPHSGLEPESPPFIRGCRIKCGMRAD